MSQAEKECKEAWSNFKRTRNFTEQIPNAVWDIEIELPEPPKDYKSIANYGKPKKDRKFPYYDREYIQEMDNLPNNSPVKKQFLDQEWDRRRNGYWFYNGDNLEWVTGHYYMTLQYWLIPIEDLDGGFGNPKFVDLHRDITYAIWWEKNHPDDTGLAYAGTRRSGKTFIGAAEGYWDTTGRYNALFGIQSKTDPDGKAILLKLVSSWQRLPAFLKPVDTGYTTVSRELMFAEPQKRSTKGKKHEYREVLNSRIYAYSSKETAMDGARTTFQFQDECFSPETELIMADGEVRAIKDIHIGEYVMGADGSPSKVVERFSGTDKMFRVSSNKFQNYDCNSLHKITCYWALKKSKTKINNKYYRYGDPINLTPQEYLNLSEYKKKHLMLKKASCNFKKQCVEVDPYLLGYWLGDGTSEWGNFCTEDIEVVEEIKKTHTIGSETVKNVSNTTGKELKMYRVDGLLDGIKKLGVRNNKHIPKQYLYNSREVRLRLLAGLIDSDGHNMKGKLFEITQKNKTLSYQIHTLASQLGFYSKISEKQATMRRTDNSIYRCTVYRVFIYGDLDKIPTKVPRKQAVIKRTKNRRSPDKAGFTVTDIGAGEYIGIKLDRSPYMMLIDGTIVHNCGKRTESDAYKTQQIAKICCVVGRKVVGFGFWATTVEEMEKGGGEAFKKIWDASNPKKRNENGRTDSTMVRLFFPAEYGLFEGGFIDEWGYSMLDEARKWLDAEENSKEGEELLDWKRKFPRNIDDCFAIPQNSNNYNQRKLFQQYQYATSLDPISQPTRGNFMWADGEKDTEVVFRPNPDGRWLVAWMPPPEDRNKKEKYAGHWRPTRQYCKTGADPFAHAAVTEAGSDAACYTILESHHRFPRMKMAWVCQYIARPKHPDEAAEDMIKQCVFYSSEFLCEKNVYGALQHFKHRGYDGYCMFNPLDPDSVNKRIKGLRGMPMTGADAGEALSNITQAHIEDHIGYNEEDKTFGFCPFPELISSWQKFDPNNRTKFDAAMAAGMALIATKKPKRKVEQAYKPSDWLGKFGRKFEK